MRNLQRLTGSSREGIFKSGAAPHPLPAMPICPLHGARSPIMEGEGKDLPLSLGERVRQSIGGAGTGAGEGLIASRRATGTR